MKIGSLFSGYGGLDIAVARHFSAEMAWYSEIETAACAVMQAHHPGVPNIGDVTEVDWSTIEPVDIITGGYPCQPFSMAGQRKGTSDERHLWPYVRDALRALRPRTAVLENVRGHLTLGLDTVLADLASMGWSAEWGVVRASDAGAPHRRERVFIIAHNPNHADTASAKWTGPESKNLPAPERATESRKRAGAATDPEGRRRGAGSGPAKESPGWSIPGTRDDRRAYEERWGKFAGAIYRWEPIIGRRAPDATVPGRNDRPRLNPVFVEWMMGLPEGWVTGHGLSASEELKMLGNGVVPQQAEKALGLLTCRMNTSNVST